MDFKRNTEKLTKHSYNWHTVGQVLTSKTEKQLLHTESVLLNLTE